MAKQTELEALVLKLRTGVYDIDLIRKIAAFGNQAVPLMIDTLGLVETSDQYFDENSLVLGNIHSMAEDVLIRIGRPAVEYLIPLLDDSRWGPRHGAIWCLHNIGDKRAIEPLRAALERYGDDINISHEIEDAVHDLERL